MNFLENSLFSTLGLIAFIFGALRLIFASLKGANFTLIVWSQTGFFVGIFWFYWISFSLVYYDFSYLIPLEILFIGLTYALIFAFFGGLGCYFLAKLQSIFKLEFYKSFKLCFFAVIFWGIQFIHPFGFNWLNFALPIVNTPFAAIFWEQKLPELPFKIAIRNTEISQFDLWKKELRPSLIKENLAFIDEAINSGARLVILPESAFAFTLNYDKNVLKKLLVRSEKIAILVGGEGYENKTAFNSAYFFDKGEFRRIDKHILVPFGEEIPLPEFFKKPINSLFFGGASDYGKAADFSYIDIDGTKIKVAICYEGTRYELYEDRPEFAVVISNNAWFRNSSQNILFHLLLKYYSLKNSSTIFHAQNK